MASACTPPGPPPFPRATYRLQFRREFTFDHATELVPYLAALGISHIYASPFLMARPGSTHGYDITDHNRFNPEVGDAAAFDRLITALHAHGMGLILDFVPNHMGVGGADNPWWLDVLEWGEASPFARFFDINWDPAPARLKGRVLLPVLGDQYGTVLENGEILLRFDEERGSFSAWYYQHRFPIAVRDYPRILSVARTKLENSGEALASLVAAFTRIGRHETAVQQAAIARREADETRAQLAALARDDADVRSAIDAAVAEFNGRPGESASFRRLHELLERQAYQISYWRVASDEINYRRFFDINDLAGLAMEDPELFEISHRLVFQLIAEGKLQGVRLDHIDGLYDPLAYCRRLQDRAAYLVLQAQGGTLAAPAAETGAPVRLRYPFYLIVEKILAGHEHLPADWPVDGTTGYEFMNLVNGLFVDPAAAEPMSEIYSRFIGREPDFPEIVLAAKRQILRNNLASELNTLSLAIYRVAQQSWRTRDFTAAAIRWALIEIIAHFPVYRTYVTEEGIAESDRRYLNWAIARACKEAVATDLSIYHFIHALLSTDLTAEDSHGYDRHDIIRTAMKFQQLTGPVMAKAFEDTALYRYHRLVSLNDVGGEPERFGVSPAAFHHLNQERLRQYPFSMLATATHDHKRGSDTRARIDVLSEIPDEWTRRVRRWRRMNRLKRRDTEDGPAPGRNDEYLLYQTLVGAWPLEINAPDDPGLREFAERIIAYMTKAGREAKVRTSWAFPNAEYEQAVEQFVRTVLDPARSSAFLPDLIAFAQRVAPAGAVNGLAQTLLRLTVPGVPDTYQGCEFWDLSLVDPDNRRPVDYAAHQRSLAQIRDGKGDPQAVLADWRSGRIKQFVTARVLDLRRRQPALFAAGDYTPIPPSGPHSEHLVAFMRRSGESCLIAVVPRLPDRLLPDSGGVMLAGDRLRETVLPLPQSADGATFTDILSGRTLTAASGLAASELLGTFPIALLTSLPSALLPV